MHSKPLIWKILLGGLLILWSGCATAPEKEQPITEVNEWGLSDPDARPKAADPKTSTNPEDDMLPLGDRSDADGENPRNVPYDVIPLPKRTAEKDIVLKDFEDSGQPQPVSIDFDNSEMTEVIRVFAALLDIDYLLEEGVSGKITVKADVHVDRGELWSLFRNLLSINRLSLTEKNGIYLVGKTDYQKPNAKFHDRARGREIQPDEGYIVQLAPVRYIPAGEMAELLKSFASPSAYVQVYSRSNMLFIVDTPQAVFRLLEIKDRFDTPNLRGIHARLYELTDVRAEIIVGELLPILTQMGIGLLEEVPAGVALVPVERLEKIIVLTGDERNFDIVEYWIDKLDHIEHQEGLRTFVYKVKNGKAEDIATLFSKMFSSVESETETATGMEPKGSISLGGGEEQDGKASIGQIRHGRGPQSLSPPGRGEAKTEGYTTQMSGEVRITNDTYSNSLIIQASLADYKALRRILEAVDVLPKQVLVETIIADISLSDSNKLGVGWSINKALQNTTAAGGATSSSLNQKPVFDFLDGKNLSVTYLDTALDLASIISLAATQSEVKVLSSPTLWATDNVSASINIGQQIPININSVQIDSAQTGNTTVSRSAQYQRVGLGLNFTPRITDAGIITMDLSLTISESSPTGDSGLPIILERSTSTSFWARDGQTIILGGLIEEGSTDSNDGIPLLKDIPILGYLFGSTTQTTRKTELVLMIRPHIIRNLDDADWLVKQFSDSIKNLHIESGWEVEKKMEPSTPE